MSFAWELAFQDLESFKAKQDEYKAAFRAAVENEVRREAGFTKIHTPDGPRWGITNAPPSGFIDPQEDHLPQPVLDAIEAAVERAVAKALAASPSRKAG
jgi:hypothetical protein